MEKNFYIAPVVLVSEIEAEDILTASDEEEGAGDEIEF